MVYVLVFTIATVVGIIWTFKDCYDLSPGYFIGNIFFANFFFILGFSIISFFASIALISEVEMVPVETVGVYELVPYEDNTNIYSVHTDVSSDWFYFKYIGNDNQKKEDSHPARTTIISIDSNESVKPTIKIEKLDYKNPVLRFFFFALGEERITIKVNDTSQILNY